MPATCKRANLWCGRNLDLSLGSDQNDVTNEYYIDGYVFDFYFQQVGCRDRRAGSRSPIHVITARIGSLRPPTP